jgi:hypothetical protein
VGGTKTVAVGSELRMLDDALAESVLEVWVPQLEPTDEDYGWEWRKLLAALCGRGDTSIFYSAEELEAAAIVCSGQVQGIVASSLPKSSPKLSRLQSLLYVEYISVAPWNRPRQGDGRIFRAVGPSLLKQVVLRSAGTGHEGRIGLHSAGVAASKFYNGLGMKNRGPDYSEDGYVFFEGDTDWSNSFCSVPSVPKTAEAI